MSKTDILNGLDTDDGYTHSFTDWVQWYHMYTVGIYDQKGEAKFWGTNSCFTIDISSRKVRILDSTIFNALKDSEYFSIMDHIYVKKNGQYLMGVNGQCVESDSVITDIPSRSKRVPLIDGATQYLECIVTRRVETEYLSKIEAKILDIGSNNKIYSEDHTEIDMTKFFSLKGLGEIRKPSD